MKTSEVKSEVKIVMTGGGTAGHVVPHLALLPELRKKNWVPYYIGSSGIEKQMIEGVQIPFFTISAGKLRRYFSVQNFFDIFKVVLGFVQSFIYLSKIKPQVVFSKGGFVSVPVAYAAWVLGIPVVTHESDLTPGLANKLVKKICRKILFTFPETEKYLPKGKSVYVGSPVREDLLGGNKNKGYEFTGLDPQDSRPVVLVMGGSLGAKNLNDLITSAIEEITKEFRVIHLTGKGKRDIEKRDGYVPFEFLSDELKDIFAITDLVVARAGANSIFEFLALKKPMMLVPLEAGSRGDQLLNASSFEASGFATLRREETLLKNGLLKELRELNLSAQKLRDSQLNFSSVRSIDKIIEQLSSCLN